MMNKILIVLILALSLSIGLVAWESVQPQEDRQNQETPAYCTSNSECDDGDVCTDDICDISLSCRNLRIKNCCYDDSDCNDDCDCSFAVCVDNRCSDYPCCDENLSCDHLEWPGFIFICEQRMRAITNNVCVPLP